jgi:predicted ATPase
MAPRRPALTSPIRIELAAARLNALTVQEIAQRLDRRFAK